MTRGLEPPSPSLLAQIPFPFVREGVDRAEAAPALSVAVAMLVEEPKLDAAINAATERFDFEEQQRLVKRKLEFDSRLRLMAGASADRTV